LHHRKLQLRQVGNSNSYKIFVNGNLDEFYQVVNQLNTFVKENKEINLKEVEQTQTHVLQLPKTK
jgi:hypothetical protein